MNKLATLQFFSLLSLLIFGFASSHQQLFEQSSSDANNEKETVRRSMFPDDFLFGVSTSAYQIEGGYQEDGKGLSNWDVFSHIHGNIENGDNGDVADDHFHRYMEDIEILSDLGVNAYRFSISWTRILPNGRFGEVNPSGVVFYNKIIDNLLLKGIQPFVTVHHFDIPQELEDRYGGWLSRSMQEDYLLLAKTCFEKFGDRVKHWITINEPNIMARMTYKVGAFPPGRCSQPFGNCSAGNSDVEPLAAVHNMLLAHAKAVQLYRNKFQSKQDGRIGIALAAESYVPYRDDNSSREAVERAYAIELTWVLDPLVYGDYPALMRKLHGTKLPIFTKEEGELMKGSLDFIGINHYTTLYAIDCFHYSSQCPPKNKRPIQGFVLTTGYRDGIPIGDQAGNSDFFVVPQGMENIVAYIKERYHNTIMYITENGYSPLNQSNESDGLHDFKRVEYYRSYLLALAKAVRKGANVKGYLPWSLMDNLEWADGYQKTYGLYYVNRTTLERKPKLSAKWYAAFLADKGLNLTSSQAHQVTPPHFEQGKAAL